MVNQAIVEQYLNDYKIFNSFDLFKVELEKRIEMQQWLAQDVSGCGGWQKGIFKLITEFPDDIEKFQRYLDTFEIKEGNTCKKIIDYVDAKLEITNIHRSETHFEYKNGSIVKTDQSGIVIGFQVRFWLDTNEHAFDVKKTHKLTSWRESYNALHTVFDFPREEFYKVVSGKETNWKGYNEPI